MGESDDELETRQQTGEYARDWTRFYTMDEIRDYTKKNTGNYTSY